jgi:hypothetical protein
MWEGIKRLGKYRSRMIVALQKKLVFQLLITVCLLQEREFSSFETLNP